MRRVENLDLTNWGKGMGKMQQRASSPDLLNTLIKNDDPEEKREKMKRQVLNSYQCVWEYEIVEIIN